MAGRLRVVEVRGRNLNLDVRVGRGGVFIKQPDPAEADSAESFQQELAFYEHNPAPQLAGWLPRLRLAQRSPPRLVLERLRDPRPLLRTLVGGRAYAAELGRALAALHASPPVAAESGAPWALGLARPGPEVFERGGPATLELIRHLQRHAPAFAALDALRASWRPTALIHGDIRAGNVLCVGKGQLRLVDWEMVQAGDPSWDLGCALAIFAERWLDALPMRGTVADALAATPLPMRRLRPMVRALLDAYGADAALRARAVSMAGARCARGVYERWFTAERLSPRGLLSLQLAINLLDPARGRAFFSL